MQFAGYKIHIRGEENLSHTLAGFSCGDERTFFAFEKREANTLFVFLTRGQLLSFRVIERAGNECFGL